MVGRQGRTGNETHQNTFENVKRVGDHGKETLKTRFRTLTELHHKIVT